MRQKLQIWYNTRTCLNTGVCHGVLVVMRALTLYSQYRVSKQHLEYVRNQGSMSFTPDQYRPTSNSTATQCMMCNKFSICCFFLRKLDKILYIVFKVSVILCDELSLCVLMWLINNRLCEIVNKFTLIFPMNKNIYFEFKDSKGVRRYPMFSLNP